MSNVSIQVSDLSIGYAGKVVQEGVCFTLHAGEMVCLLGPNGCGKTTLMRTLAGLIPSLKGDYPHHRLDTSLSLVLTAIDAMETTTVRDVVAMGRYPYTSWLGQLNDEDERIIDRCLRAVDIDPGGELMERALIRCSDGERQRVLIAKALAQQTPIILLDEPTAHLDIPNRIRVMELLSDLAHHEGKTILISTHELSLAMHMADKVIMMRTMDSAHPQGGVVLDTPDGIRLRGCLNDVFGMDVSRFA